MNIIVAGTGFSSILCINYLVNLGLKPTVIDIGRSADQENKNILKKKSLINQRNIDEFHYFGGCMYFVKILFGEKQNSFSDFCTDELRRIFDRL